MTDHHRRAALPPDGQESFGPPPVIAPPCCLGALGSATTLYVSGSRIVYLVGARCDAVVETVTFPAQCEGRSGATPAGVCPLFCRRTRTAQNRYPMPGPHCCPGGPTWSVPLVAPQCRPPTVPTADVTTTACSIGAVSRDG